jgi:hypothetical protein
MAGRQAADGYACNEAGGYHGLRNENTKVQIVV